VRSHRIDTLPAPLIYPIKLFSSPNFKKFFILFKNRLSFKEKLDDEVVKKLKNEHLHKSLL